MQTSSKRERWKKRLILATFVITIVWILLTASLVSSLGQVEVTGSAKQVGEICDSGEYAQLLNIGDDPFAIAGCSGDQGSARRYAAAEARDLNRLISLSSGEEVLLYGSMPAAALAALTGIRLYRNDQDLLPQDPPNGVRAGVYWFGVFGSLLTVIAIGAGLSMAWPDGGLYSDVVDTFYSGVFLGVFHGWTPAALLTGVYAIARSGGDD